MHRGEHVAFVMDKPLERGRVIPVPVWPAAIIGETICCGTCGEILQNHELNGRDTPLQEQN
jgi:hypothetical protein